MWVQYEAGNGVVDSYSVSAQCSPWASDPQSCKLKKLNIHSSELGTDCTKVIYKSRFVNRPNGFPPRDGKQIGSAFSERLPCPLFPWLSALPSIGRGLGLPLLSPRPNPGMPYCWC